MSDPANLRSAKLPKDAFRQLAGQKVLFHSRADGSATMEKERQIWLSSGVEPWKHAEASRWYKTSLDSPPEALKAADQAGAYILTDRSTLLCQTRLGTISKTTVFLEPQSSYDILMNSCYALYSPLSVAGAPMRVIVHFIDYLLSARGQFIIGSFGINSCGLPLFAPIAEGFSKTKLAGGQPVGQKWAYKASW